MSEEETREQIENIFNNEEPVKETIIEEVKEAIIEEVKEEIKPNPKPKGSRGPAGGSGGNGFPLGM